MLNLKQSIDVTVFRILMSNESKVDFTGLFFLDIR